MRLKKKNLFLSSLYIYINKKVRIENIPPATFGPEP